MTNNTPEVFPFLVQFETDIPASNYSIDGSSPVDSEKHSVDLERATKLTRVRDETTDDE